MSALAYDRLDASRKELLDLSFRNALLNYRLLRSRGIEVKGAVAAQVYETLVVDDKKMSFASTEREPTGSFDTARYGFRDTYRQRHPFGSGDPGFVDLAKVKADSVAPAADEIMFALDIPQAVDALAVKPEPRKTVNTLPTSHTAKELQSRLLNTYYTARTFLEEQGINTLYLTLGSLVWYEDDHSDQVRISPLILIPVDIERAGVGGRFQISYRDEEVGDNMSLAAYLSNNFGLTLPDLPEETDDINIDDYFDKVQAVIHPEGPAVRGRWRIDRSAVAVGFFSFSKYQMFRDLEAYDPTDGAEVHPILEALLGDGFNEPESQYSDNENLDQVMSPRTANTVIDCDSTQALAILDVAAGRNMVIQGPPGTGKSQTITNIIADAIGRGKRVLFVAEKSAALAVVRDRLDRLELGHCCLELHSNKTNKKAVLRDLQSTLELGQPVMPHNEDNAAMLISLQNRLSDYCGAVNTPVGQSGLTPYALFGECIVTDSGEGADLIQIPIPTASDWTSLEYREREQLVNEIQAQLNAIATSLPPKGVLAGHPFWGSRRTTCLPADIDHCRDTAKAAADTTVKLRDSVAVLEEALTLPPSISPEAAATVVRATRATVDAPPHAAVADNPADWLAYPKPIEDLLKAGLAAAKLRAKYEALLIPDAWTSPSTSLNDAHRILLDHKTKWWRIFVPAWHRAHGVSLALWRDKPSTIDDELAAIDAIFDMQSQQTVIAKQTKIGEKLFGQMWDGVDSDFSTLASIANWIIELAHKVSANQLSLEAMQNLVHGTNIQQHTAELVEAETGLAAFSLTCASAVDAVTFDPSRRFGGGATLEAQSFSIVAGLFASWASNAGALREMSVFNSAAERAEGLGLGPVVDAAARMTPGGSLLTRSFRRSYLGALVNRCLQDTPALASFSGTAHDEVVTQFRALDLRLLADNRTKLARLHWDNLPSTNGEGQVRILRREFEKKSRHLALRRLLSEAGRAVQAIKPAFMMSPLSVATYLAPHQVDFDLVVFDEASQVRPVDAFGALLRGRQAVVVGDSKQLPPTAFFDTITSLDNVADDSVVSDVESVLGLFLAQGAPQRTLRWHYRSRHESLIAISNEEFYDNKLVIFPSPDSERRQYGLYYHQLPETVYDRGRSSTNRLEAKVVAEAVMAHASAQIQLPDTQWHSLGVAAFSMGQMEAIIEEVEALRHTRPECEPFFAAGRVERFFVKNLESVQGDERDVIYISVGYGRDAAGKVSMNFGPLNGQGGERRLNVLITRARLRCEVFTNLADTDLRVDDNTPRGVVAFKRFLAFARTGILDSPASTTAAAVATDSMLAAIRAALTDRGGYKIATQVGCAGYYVDIAVRDPADESRYLVAVECDGPNYGSARSSRDRDRLREHVMRTQGWQVHRVWSTDWLSDPRGSLTRLIQTVEDAKRVEVPLDTAQPDVEDKPVEAVVRVQAARATRAIALYTCAELAPLTGWSNAAPPAGAQDTVTQIVTIESPVHIAEIARRIADAAGITRVTEKFRATVEAAIAEATVDKHIMRRGDFCWMTGAVDTPLRNRAYLPPVSRKMEYVAPEEIDAALRYCLAESYGMPTDDLIRATGRALGFERLGDDNQAIVEVRIEALELAGHIISADGRVRLV